MTFKFDNAAAVERAQVPIDHLIKIGARCMWQKDINAAIRVEEWRVGMKVYIVRFFDNGGWDVYAPVDESNSVETTLAKITA